MRAVVKWLGVGAGLALGFVVMAALATTLRLYWLDWLAGRPWRAPPCTEAVLPLAPDTPPDARACQGGARLHVWDGVPVCLCSPPPPGRAAP